MKKAADFDIKDFLDQKADQFNRPDFIELDPVSIPHMFSKKEDIEIAGFLAATIAWGQRSVILRNARQLLTLMDDDPHQFILDFKAGDLKRFQKFIHRTFNATDLTYFLNALKRLYKNHGGLEAAFSKTSVEEFQIRERIMQSRELFFRGKTPGRTAKHYPDTEAGSAAKRVNMFLRWMVRSDSNGVDFGIWKNISPSILICPLDVHSGRVARKLGLLTRKQNDWKAAEELTAALRKLDSHDPVRYDFALFGLGVMESF